MSAHIEGGWRKPFEELNIMEQSLIGPRRWPTYTAAQVAYACVPLSPFSEENIYTGAARASHNE